MSKDNIRPSDAEKDSKKYDNLGDSSDYNTTGSSRRSIVSMMEELDRVLANSRDLELRVKKDIQSTKKFLKSLNNNLEET